MSSTKRDKFAALAASQAGRAAVDNGKQDVAGSVTKSTVVDGDRHRGGDKFAALQKASPAPKRDKFSAMASRSITRPDAKTGAEMSDCSEMSVRASTEKLKEWKTRCLQREELWTKLEETEVHVLGLLGLAQKTVESLARQTKTDEIDQRDIQQLAYQVPRCIQAIHDNLAPAAQYITPYEVPQRIGRLYKARLEEGLAAQRQQVLEQLMRLEEAVDASALQHTQKKTKREER